MIPHNQLSLEDIFQDCQEKFSHDKPLFLSLLQKYINLDDLIPDSFRDHFYASTGRPRKYSLHALLWALVIQRIFSIPTDQLLLTFLHYSKPLRDFCGFDKVPDASKITRFKQNFRHELQQVFSRLVDLTEPICQAIDTAKADMTVFDSSGIEAYVTENNPKFANRIIRQLKAYAKANGYDKNFDPYKAAYASMPSHAASNPQIRQLFINGHFCYVFKFAIVTNGLGIVRHISFYNKDFFSLHPLLNPKTFLGDAAFDTVQIYKDLLSGDTFGPGRHFDCAYIPLNTRSHPVSTDYTVDENGIPCCPHDPSLPMRPETSRSHLRCGLPTLKFVCPKMRWEYDKVTKKAHRVCHCENPCTSSKCGRMIYIYPEKDLRTYPGTVRGTDEWNCTYKIRTAVEREINHFKENLCVSGRRTQNEQTLHADLILAGITQLISVLLADKIHHHEYIRSLKPLIV